MSSQLEIAAAKRALRSESHSKGMEYIADTNIRVMTAIKQVETIECTAGESTGAGDITMTITSANMIGSPRAVVVAIEASDAIADVIEKVKAALNADEFIPAVFTVGGAADTITLTPITAIANDSTLAFGFVDTDTTGVTFGASTNTTTAVMPDSSVIEGEVYCEILCIAATTFAVLTPASDFDIVGTVTGVAFPAGTRLYGRFITIDLTSGSVLAYKV